MNYGKWYLNIANRGDFVNEIFVLALHEIELTFTILIERNRISKRLTLTKWTQQQMATINKPSSGESVGLLNACPTVTVEMSKLIALVDYLSMHNNHRSKTSYVPFGKNHQVSLQINEK